MDLCSSDLFSPEKERGKWGSSHTANEEVASSPLLQTLVMTHLAAASSCERRGLMPRKGVLWQSSLAPKKLTELFSSHNAGTKLSDDYIFPWKMLDLL
ncbi:Kinesin-Like Protein Kif26A [Manis pentadactyla]|nr:Kinesin-Like Protein Kif26A [Manis pentadactyla]